MSIVTIVPMKMLYRFLSLCCFSSQLLLKGASAGIDVYASPPDIETAEDSGITGVSTENFSARPVGTFTNFRSSTINGSYTLTAGTASIQSNNIYGGFEEGNQLAVNPQTGRISLTLDAPVRYFGFYFTAGDAANTIDLYNGPTLQLSFSTGSLISLLPNNSTATIKAINGANYNTINYYGQPVTGSNSNETYAYLHFIASGATMFDRVVLSQVTSSTAIFENDNHSVRTTAPAIPNTLVLIPEPASLAGLGLGLLALRRRRQG